MQLVIGSTYESSRGFGRLLYLGETHGIDGYLPTFRTSKGEFKHYRYDQLPGALVEFSVPTVSRADELIACLEGEIAKRDEELAACRVAVENCEVFRARIVELEDLVLSLQCKAIESDDLRAELAAIKAQEPATDSFVQQVPDKCDRIVWRGRYYGLPFSCTAAPVSESKAQGVVMPEREVITNTIGFEFLPGELQTVNSDDLVALVHAARLNAAPVQQVSVPPFAQKVIRKLERFQECMDDGQGADIGRHWFDLLTQLGLLNRVQRSPALWEITQQGEDLLVAAPAAPASGAGLVEALRELADQFREAWPEHTGKYHFLIGAGLSIAAHRTQGVV